MFQKIKNFSRRFTINLAIGVLLSFLSLQFIQYCPQSLNYWQQISQSEFGEIWRDQSGHLQNRLYWEGEVWVYVFKPMLALFPVHNASWDKISLNQDLPDFIPSLTENLGFKLSLETLLFLIFIVALSSPLLHRRNLGFLKYAQLSREKIFSPVSCSLIPRV